METKPSSCKCQGACYTIGSDTEAAVPHYREWQSLAGSSIKSKARKRTSLDNKLYVKVERGRDTANTKKWITSEYEEPVHNTHPHTHTHCVYFRQQSWSSWIRSCFLCRVCASILYSVLCVHTSSEAWTRIMLTSTKKMTKINAIEDTKV